MGMQGIGYSDLLRSSTDEFLISSLMDNPIGKTEPSLEMLGFKNVMRPFKEEGEEPFGSWLMNGEFSASPIAIRTRHVPLRNSQEEVIPDNSFHLTKGWFQSVQPLTESITPELRKYDFVQESQVPMVSDEPHHIPGQGANCMKQDFKQMSNSCTVTIAGMPNQQQTFMSDSDPSASFDTAITTTSTLGSVLSLLTGTLDHENLDGKVGRDTYEIGSFGMFNSQEVALSTSSAQGLGKKDSIFHMFSPVDAPNNGNFATINKAFELSLEGLPTEVNHRQTGALSREHSPSESPIAEPTLSGGFEVCDDPDQSGHAYSNYGNPRKHGRDVATKNESRINGFSERVFDSSFNGTGKKESLARMNLLTSGASDPTKKRRIERSRKMAEAKERSLIPSLPSDMQTALKRCESLEKEIRSLKLNLSFMNRKDSEQSKQIEELQKRNEELTEEKEQLLEEKERIISGYEKS